MSRALFILALVVAVSSCKKYRLNGDQEILVGEWEWIRSDMRDLNGGGGDYTIYPATEGFTASIIFAKRNKITFKKDGEVTLEGRVKILSFAEPPSSTGMSWRGTYKVIGNDKEYSVDFIATSDDVMYSLGFPIDGDAVNYVRRNVFHRK
jgi:hypothetical protein